MQLAKQVYKLETPPNALLHFKDGSPAYLVKRFDVLPDGTKRRQEDFAALAGKTPDKKGDYKYNYTYEGIAKLMKQHLPAYAVEVEKFFRLVLINYIIGNGDAHLKNFSVSETTLGDHRLSPTYDLLCSKLHIEDDSDMALELFDDDFSTDSFNAIGFHSQEDFRTFGEKIGMKTKRIEKEIQFILAQLPAALERIHNSFLSEELKTKFQKQVKSYTEQRLGYVFNQRTSK
jgi:serine/threonine-protein kinase HipA